MSLRHGIITGVTVALLAGFLGAPSVVWAEGDEPTRTEIVFDLVLIRPVGAVVTVAGTAIFIVSSPFALITGSIKNTADKLVADPYTFNLRSTAGRVLAIGPIPAEIGALQRGSLRQETYRRQRASNTQESRL